MIKTIIKREVISYLKNPIFYIGAIIVCIFVYMDVSPYINIHYFTEESEIGTIDRNNQTEISDADIMEGYIPTMKEEQYKMGMDKIYNVLIEGFNMTQKEAEAVILVLYSRKMSIAEIDEYMELNYSYYSAKYEFYDSEMKKATVEEANQYIEMALKQETYTSYFSRKYADYLGVYIIFYAILMFAFLYRKDSKKDIYELLHTKPIKAWQYITGKILGGMTAMSLVVMLITTIFNYLVIKHGISAGFPVSFWDIWLAMILYVLPNLFMVISVYTGVAVLFKTPLPAVPALVLYMIYSNMGSILEDGRYGYQIRKLAILVRFPDIFFETNTPIQAIVNQMSLVAIAMIIATASILIWKRRRVY